MKKGRERERERETDIYIYIYVDVPRERLGRGGCLPCTGIKEATRVKSLGYQEVELTTP